MIAQDFGPERTCSLEHALATESIADLRLREHGRARGQKTSEGSLREAQAGAASAVCQWRFAGFRYKQLIS